MAIRYHIEKMNTLLEHLAGVLHVSVLLLDQNGKQLSKIYDPADYCSTLQTVEGMRPKCQECDKRIMEQCKQSKKIEKHLCHAGLFDLAMPIIKDEIVVAYIVLGRIRTTQSPAVSRYNESNDILCNSYQSIPFFTEEQLQHLTKLLPIMVLNGAITIEYEAFDADILSYIDEHLTETLSISSLCKRYHVSKNTIYRYFREHFGCSVVEYITSVRINCAKELLCNSDSSIASIAEKVGIENYTYFCKLFKTKVGHTPTAYRKQYKKTDESI